MICLLPFIILVLQLLAVESLESDMMGIPTSKSRIPWNITQMILKGYDPRLRPNFGNPNKPVQVKVDLVVGSVDEISEVNMDFTLTIYLRQYWKDHRLSFGHILGDDIDVMPVDGRITDHLWLPDTYFTNDKDSYLQDITVKNRMVRIMKDGTVVFGLRLSITASCVFELKKFPHDIQTCALFLESYGYNTKDIRLLWADDCVSGFDKVELPQFRVTDWQCTSLMANFSSGFYDRLNLEFVLAREVGFFVFQTYMPCIMVVCMSWVSFWINNESSPARVALGITTVLTMTTIFTSSRASLPRFSYVKAIDIYLLTCFVFVFASLIEFAIINFNYWKLTHNRNKELKKQQKQEAKELQRRQKNLTKEEISALSVAASADTPTTAVPSTNISYSHNVQQILESQSENQMGAKIVGSDYLGYRNGEAFHPGYIRTIQFSDYCASLPTFDPQSPFQQQTPRTYMIAPQNGNEAFYRRGFPLPVVSGLPLMPGHTSLASNPLSYNMQHHRPGTISDGVTSFTTIPQPQVGGAYSTAPQPSISQSGDSLMGESSNEWYELKQSFNKIFRQIGAFFAKFPIPSGENVIVIDSYSRIFFPAAFTIFNLLYWWHYILDSA